jgi:aromatic-amino-acid transaminase
MSPAASLFSAVEMAPRDPILGITEAFAADTNPKKVNLGVGVYYDDNGKLPLLKCVQAAEKAMTDDPKARGYLPIDGIAAYDAAAKALVFGADSEPVKSGRVATVQGVGGTGALKLGADFLKKLNPNAKVLISDPSWENHRALFTNAGFLVESHPYFDPSANGGLGGINFAGMLAAFNAAPAGTIVVLHACCHNPTGYDITASQWDQVVATVKAKGLVPFLDMAYQGFGYGLKEDGMAVQKFVDAGLTFFVSTSFSKSFSLYGERAGALSVLCQSKDEAARVLSQLKIVIRTNYSNPPTHGGAVVAAVMADPKLRAMWEEELGEMRVRIKAMRQKLVDGLKAAGVKQDMSFITTQIGMFSYSGLTKDQMVRLRTEFGVYGTDAGRMCVAALNSKNIDHVCASIAKVV